MKQKGFTLIELLAVIVILGVILVIAIPSISAAILNSRKNAYVATANEFVDGVRITSLTDPTILPGPGEEKFISISEIKLEKGSKTKSPFGKTYDPNVSGVYINYDATEDKYIYKVCLVDAGANGINLEDIITVDKSDVKIGEATCDGSEGSGGNGSDDPVIGSSSDWEVSNEPNGTGGYTLIGFIGDMDNSNSIEVTEDYYNDANLSIIFKAFYGIEDASEMSNRNAYTVNIPNVVDGKTITELGSTVLTGIDFVNFNPEEEDTPPPYEPNLRIKEVNIPEGIVKTNGIYDEENYFYIGSFTYNLNLTSVSLPSTLKDIGAGAFLMNNLTSLTLPSSLETIDHYAFAFHKIASLTIPSSVETIGDLAFANPEPDFVISRLTTLIFEGAENGTSSLTTLGEWSFAVNKITSLTLPSSLKTISSGAFSENNITSLIIPKTVETIASQAFRGNSLSSLIFEGANDGTSSLKTIGGNNFNIYNVNEIIYLPASLERVREDDNDPGQPFSCDYRESLCTIYINQYDILFYNYQYDLAGNYARTYKLDGSGGYTCICNCP